MCDVEKYKIYRNALTKLKRISKINYYKYKCEEYKNNTKKLWGLINSCIGKHNDKSTVIDCLKIGNMKICDSKQIANELGNYFSTSKTNINNYLKVIPRNAKSLYFTLTTDQEVVNLINKLPNKKSSGCDNVDNIILKQIKECIAPKLAENFHLSMLEGRFPDKMKLAEVVPLYKSKEKFLPGQLQTNLTFNHYLEIA